MPNVGLPGGGDVPSRPTPWPCRDRRPGSRWFATNARSGAASSSLRRAGLRDEHADVLDAARHLGVELAAVLHERRRRFAHVVPRVLLEDRVLARQPALAEALREVARVQADEMVRGRRGSGGRRGSASLPPPRHRDNASQATPSQSRPVWIVMAGILSRDPGARDSGLGARLDAGPARPLDCRRGRIRSRAGPHRGASHDASGTFIARSSPCIRGLSRSSRCSSRLPSGARLRRPAKPAAKGAAAAPQRVTSTDPALRLKGFDAHQAMKQAVALQGPEVAVPRPEERQRPVASTSPSSRPRGKHYTIYVADGDAAASGRPRTRRPPGSRCSSRGPRRRSAT